MKKSVLFGVFLLTFGIFVITLSGVHAAACDLKVSLVNQDPYPAVQGDSVKLLFQVSGVQNSECKGAYFRLDPEYSFSFADSKDSTLKALSGSTYTQSYKTDWLIPYTLKVNDDALDGNQEVKVYYNPGASGTTNMFSQAIDVNVQDSRANFEVHVKDYNYLTKTLTFEILNIAKVDVKALTVEVPDQENVQIKGAKFNIVGDLDSNSYTTADFEAVPKDGNITLEISYTDKSNVRRSIQKQVMFESKYFEDRATGQSGSSVTTWIIVLVILGLIVFWYLKRKKKKKLMAERRKLGK